MPVHAAEFDILTVEHDHAVFNVDLAHAHFFCNPFFAAADHKRIQIRGLCVPKHGLIEHAREQTVFGLSSAHGISLGVQQLAGDFRRAACFKGYTDFCLLQIAFQQRFNGIVKQMLLRTREQIHVAENAAHAELILILKIRAIAPLEHQHLQFIHSVFDEIRHVKLRRAVGNLAVAHEPAVQPYIFAAVNPFKAQRLPLSVRLLIRKAARIKTARILCRHIRRIKGDRIKHVGVLMAVIAMILPDRRYRNLPFSRQRQKLLRKIQNAVIERKTPFTAEQQKSI